MCVWCANVWCTNVHMRFWSYLTLKRYMKRTQKVPPKVVFDEYGERSIDMILMRRRSILLGELYRQPDDNFSWSSIGLLRMAKKKTENQNRENNCFNFLSRNSWRKKRIYLLFNFSGSSHSIGLVGRLEKAEDLCRWKRPILAKVWGFKIFWRLKHCWWFKYFAVTVEI